ncbi:hypothetical protein ABZ461_33365 [Actinacidiphila glaucinigra]|uniref:hypothetical protein n=1 Tax=Actinacidiphila glaucinigra TaxID=235986 RepID=UPI0033FCE51D
MPLTQKLINAVQGYAFAPSAGLRIGEFGAVVGMGDLLAYALFTTVAYKAYGRSGLTLALGLIAVFGALVPTLTPITVEALTGHFPEVVPAQIFFGPAAPRRTLPLTRAHGAPREQCSGLVDQLLREVRGS